MSSATITTPVTTAPPPYVAAHTAASAKGISSTVTLHSHRVAPLSLHVLIVGCGLGGLSAAFTLAKAGHRVTLFETASKLGEVGAGIQVTPNISKQLRRWGLGDVLAKISVVPEGIVFRRYNDGNKVGYTSWRGMESDYDAPYYHIHRADLHHLLYDLVADTHDVTLRLGATVQDVYPGDENGVLEEGQQGRGRPFVKLVSGEVVEGDLIVAADGVKSMIRQIVTGRPTTATPTGDAAYRALVPCSLLMEDPDLRPLVETPEMTAWMAPGRHLMGYCIRAKQQYNMVLIRPDDGSVESWTAEGSADKMRAEFSDFEPRVQKLLAMVPSTLKWKLMDRDPLDTWVHPAGRIVLLGDSCHPMLPYRAQGAAMAVEDAVVLGNLLSRLEHLSQLKPILQGYQDLRLPRTAETQMSSRLNQKIFHLPDGPEQAARDASMRAAMLDPDLPFEGNQNQWADQKKNIEQFGYDAEAAAEDWWGEVGEQQIGPLARQEEDISIISRL